MNVGLITCRSLPEPDPDQVPLLRALEDAGIEADMVAWDDRDADVSRFDRCVLRSCWNYYERPDAFMRWIDGADRHTRLFNGADVVRWNLHKRYLAELERKGVPIIPTRFVERGQRVVVEDTEWDKLVIKPAISAGSFQTRSFERRDPEAQAFADELVATRDIMLQCYIASVETGGEQALVWIDGELTHAVVKRPRFADGDEEVSPATPVGTAERAIAEAALSCVSAELLYARVDVMTHDDSLVVSEVELMEPSLFFVQQPSALARFVAALTRR